MKNTITDFEKSVSIYKKFGTFNWRLITASHIIILTYEMTINERFNMIGLTLTSTLTVT